MKAINTEYDLIDFIKNWFQENDNLDLYQEHVVVMAVDNKNMPRKDGIKIIAIGDHCSAYIDIKAIARHLILTGASAFFMWHNHPSDKAPPKPSSHDIQVTAKVREAMELFGITLHDHIVISSVNWSANSIKA